ncbi:Girdin [Dissostichus eleginoides]|uniref:Girdin n=1 Tax=Dissostichus eleginoides TaxID=100907 RepID=A0AAD9BKT5_DISEL|nr:Girdin [Dissostichus eleginoides]
MIRLQAENNELKVNGKIITVEAQNDGLKENLQTLQAQNNGLQVQVKTLETQIKGLQQDIRTLQGQRSGLGGVVNFEKAQENRNVLQETESNLLANPISKKRRAKVNNIPVNANEHHANDRHANDLPTYPKANECPANPKANERPANANKTRQKKPKFWKKVKEFFERNIEQKPGCSSWI